MIYQSRQWINDLNLVLKYHPEISELKGCAVMITGAAGLVCSAVTDLLILYNETREDKIQIYAAGRWPSEMESRFGEYYKRDYFHFVEYDASKADNPAFPAVDYVIHGASNASPDIISKEPVETMLSNIVGLEQLLKYARNSGVKRLLYISSSEVYGIKDKKEPFAEADYGYIDLLKPRNSYSVAKRAAETLCSSYADEYGVDTVIVRPGHIYGPTASPYDQRVSSAFAYASARGEALIMKSPGTQLRSYCYCLDCASAILKVLLHGEVNEAYNISNPESIITIRELAELLAAAGKVEICMELASEMEKKRFNPMDNSSLDSRKLENLGWKGLFSAERGLGHTVAILKELISYGSL